MEIIQSCNLMVGMDPTSDIDSACPEPEAEPTPLEPNNTLSVSESDADTKESLFGSQTKSELDTCATSEPTSDKVPWYHDPQYSGYWRHRRYVEQWFHKHQQKQRQRQQSNFQSWCESMASYHSHVSQSMQLMASYYTSWVQTWAACSPEPSLPVHVFRAPHPVPPGRTRGSGLRRRQGQASHVQPLLTQHPASSVPRPHSHVPDHATRGPALGTQHPPAHMETPDVTSSPQVKRPLSVSPSLASEDEDKLRSGQKRRRSKKSKKKKRRRLRQLEMEKQLRRAEKEEEESLLEMEITDDMLEFFAHSAKHRKERDFKKPKTVEEAKQEEHIDLGTVNAGKNKATALPPGERPGTKRTSEMKYLYGKGAAMIHGMETAMQLNFDRNCDRQQPKNWPHLPIKIVF